MRSPNEFLEFADALRAASDVKSTLRVVVDAAVRMTVSAQATVRMLEPESGKLLFSDRAGEAMHRGGAGRFDAVPGNSALGWCIHHAEPLFIKDPATDERFVARAGQTWMPSGILAVPLIERDEAVGVLSVARKEEAWPYTPHDLDTLRLIAELAVPYLQLERLVGLAERDALTGLNNRHHLGRVLPELVDTARRRGEPLSAVLLDLDHFGTINKDHSYTIGDRALRTTARVLADAVRVVDDITRTGGEEFLLLLPDTTMDAAMAVAERLRVKIRKASFTYEAKGKERAVALAASIGVGPVHPGDTVESVIDRLDEPVRQAKRRGRNRVERTCPPDALWETYFDNTRANWRRVPAAPEREPDFESASGSRYWNVRDGIYRSSDHWNESISGCAWLLDGEVVQEQAIAYLPYTAFDLILPPPSEAELRRVPTLPRLAWHEYRNIVVLTGGGIMPPRDEDGRIVPWDRLDARTSERLAAARLKRAPGAVREAFLTRAQRARRTRPNAAHRALARLEQGLGDRQRLSVLTHNIDGLHQRAGSRNVIELHGTLTRLRCPDADCGFVCPSFGAVEACRECGSPMRPDVVLLGEALAPRVSQEVKKLMRDCDLFLAIGVSTELSTVGRVLTSAVYEQARRIRIHHEPVEPAHPAFDENLIGPPELIVPCLVESPGELRA